MFYYPFRLDKDIPFGAPASPGSPLDRTTSESLAQQAIKAIDQLSFRAVMGDEDALEHLYKVATQGTNHLVKLAERKPELFHTFVRNWPVFPMLVSPKDEPKMVNKRVNKRRELLDRLGVAANLGKTFSNKSRSSLVNLATRYAAAMHYTVKWNQALLRLQARPDKRAAFDSYRKTWPDLYVEVPELPLWVLECENIADFGKATWKQWFTIGWQAVMHKSDGHPERDRELRTLGLHRKKHHATAKPGSKTEAADIRDGIKARLKQAMRSIVL